MDVQFRTVPYPFLKTITQGRQSREEVQQIKLPDSYPDIGRVVDCYGQVILRSKEWRNDGIRVSGGTMVWVLYVPEDGSGMKSVEGWIPFQGKWEFRETKVDGSVFVSAYIQNMDARSVSPRKLMVRCCVSMVAEALEPSSYDIIQPEQLPQEIQMKINTYPLEVPLEAGEKIFQLDEPMEIKEISEPIQKILFCKMDPVVLESKILANRLVFRGKVNVYILYGIHDRETKAVQYEIPFSQYTDLIHDYTDAATATVQTVLTASEVEVDGTGILQGKCGISAQYIIHDRRNLTVMEDAYHTENAMSMEREELAIPVRLDVLSHEIPVDIRFEDCEKPLNASFQLTCPEISQVSDKVEVRVSGAFRMLKQNQEDAFQTDISAVDETWTFPSAEENRLRIRVQTSDHANVTQAGDSSMVHVVVNMDAEVLSQQKFSVVSALDVGEQKTLDPDRPSVILRRASGDSLWMIAKQYGSTVDSLQNANGMEGEPEPNQLLIIPIS